MDSWDGEMPNLAEEVLSLGSSGYGGEEDCSEGSVLELQRSPSTSTLAERWLQGGADGGLVDKRTMIRRCGERRQANGNVEMFWIERAETEEKVEETSQYIAIRKTVCTEEIREVTMPVVSLDNTLDEPDVVVLGSDNIPEVPECGGGHQRMSRNEGSLACFPSPGTVGAP